MRFFTDDSYFCRTIGIIQINVRKYMENLLEPEGKANRGQSLKKKSLEITRYYSKIFSSNLTLSLLSVIYFLYRTQVNNLSFSVILLILMHSLGLIKIPFTKTEKGIKFCIFFLFNYQIKILNFFGLNYLNCINSSG